MTDAVREQLRQNPSVPLTVAFVVQQAAVFDAFQAKVKLSSTASGTRSPSSSASSNLESAFFLPFESIPTVIFHSLLEVNHHSDHIQFKS